MDRLGLRRSGVLVAVSGGVDSTALLHLLHELGPRSELQLAVGHVDHGLRGEESAADARFVGALARELGLPFHTEVVDPQALRDGGPSRARPTLQEAARRLRYAALRRMALASGADAIATAHHADDQAETVLLRLLRGSGPDGLGGIPEQSGADAGPRVVRPLLAVSRAEIEAFASERGLRWREDPSNGDPAYTRNRLREHWLPGLAADFNPQLLRTLADLAETCRTDALWMAEAVGEEAQLRLRKSQEGIEIVRDGWNDLPQALARRLARRALQEMGAGREVTKDHLQRIVAFVGAPPPAESGRSLELPLGLRLERRSQHCLLRRAPVRAEGAC